MTNAATDTAPPRGARRLVARLQERGRDETGFVLLETMIALTLITVIMAAVSVEYVNGVIVSAQQRSAATASQLASSAMADLRSYNATDLLTGRSQDDVITQRNRLRAIERVESWVSGSEAVTAYSTAGQQVVPTTPQETIVGGRGFRVDRYLECVEDSTAGACASAGNLTRLIVAVVWDERGCSDTGCAFVSATLVDTHADPTFDINQPLPTAPVVVDPGDQTVVVDDVVDLRLLVQDGTGAAPFAWSMTAGALPNELALSPDGLVSGTVRTPVPGSPITSTLTVTDAFQRQASVTVRWTVKPALALAEVAPRVGLYQQQVDPLTLEASGGSGGYRFDVTGLPGGLTLDDATGVISGSPDSVGVFDVVATVTDSGDRTVSRSFTWTVNFPPLVVSQPSAQTSTVDQSDELQITAEGGSGTYTFRAPDLPGGLSIDGDTGLISGTPTTEGSTTVTVIVTDGEADLERSVTFTWTVHPKPTISPPADRTNSQGATVSIPVTTSCANGPCTYEITGQPSTISFDEAHRNLVGTIAETVTTTSYTVELTVTDAAGATVSTQFVWTVVASPTVDRPNDQSAQKGESVSLRVTSRCPDGPCTYSVTGQPDGLTMTEDIISGTVAQDAKTSTNVIVTLTDASKVSRSTSPFTWTIR